MKTTARSNSTDSSASTESSNSVSNARSTTNTGASRFSTARETTMARNRGESLASSTSNTKKPFVSRFLPQHTTTTVENRSDKFESSSEEESTSEDSEEEIETKNPSTTAARSGITPSSSTYRDLIDRRTSRDESSLRPSYTTSNVSNNVRSRAVPAPHHASNDDDRFSSSTASR